MNLTANLPAFFNYLLPVVGWVFVAAFQRNNRLAMFHLRQAIGLVIFLVLVFLAWAGAAWTIAWIPFAFIFSMALFALVIVAILYAVFAWVMGMINALRGREAFLPFFGRQADRLLRL